MTTEIEQKDKPRKSPSLILTEGKDGALGLGFAGDIGPLLRACANENVMMGLLRQIGILGSHGNRTDAQASNFVLGFADAMKPKDPAEALLVSQMAAIHQATMMLARRLNHVENIPQQDAAERALNKLARTYAMQMEALKRYRTGGQQKVIVEHVTVNAGGQAIVGAVNRGGGAEQE